MTAQVPKDSRVGRFVVTKDGLFYWVRENDGTNYWPSRGIFFWKFFAIRRAKELTYGGTRLVNGHEAVVWEASH